MVFIFFVVFGKYRLGVRSKVYERVVFDKFIKWVFMVLFWVCNFGFIVLGRLESRKV